MCPWVGPHAPSFGRQLWGLPSRVEYLSPQGVLLPLVYGTTASPLWLELRGHSAWQATPSWTVYRLACHRLLPWLRVTFAMVPDEPGRARTCGPGVPLLPLARWVGWVAPVRPTHGVLVLSCFSAALRVCSVLGHLAPVHRCARVVCGVACAVSWATWLPFTGALAGCVVLRVRCPGPLGSCSPVRPLGVLLCVCGVLGLLAPVHRCARSVCCIACAVSWATWLLFTGAPARCVELRVWCLGPPGSPSPACTLGVLLCVCGVLGLLAPVHRCARSLCCVACVVSLATWLLFTGAPARCVVLRVRCPGPLFFLGGGGLRRFWGCAWVWLCAGAGAGVGVGVVGDGGRVAVALWVPCVCAGPQASGFQGAGLGGAAGGWLAVVVAWRLRGWSRLLGSAWVAWPGAGVRVGVFMAWADGVVGSVGVAGLCGCRVCVRRRRGGFGWGTVGDAMGAGDAGDA